MGITQCKCKEILNNSLTVQQYTNSEIPESLTHQPAKLLDGANVNDSVVKVVHKLWHILIQEPLVRMHRVAYKTNETNKRHDCGSQIS